MTDKRISPLQWLSTKFASLNHTHNEYLTSHQDITGKEDKTNKSSSISTDTGSTTKYPTVKAVEDYVSLQVSEDYGTFTELQTLINNTSNGSTLNLDKDYQCQNGENLIEINNYININGNGHIIDGNNMSNIGMYGATNLYNVKFINCHSDYNGGAVYVYGTIKIDNCLFMNNTSGGNGGALDFESDDSVVTNCVFINNKSQGSGGVLYSEYEGYKFINCIFSNNSSDSNGGALFVAPYEDDVTIKDCIFVDNTATGDGGGIYAYTNEEIKVYNCTFIESSLYNTRNVNYIAEDQPLKTINNESILGTGNISVSPTIDSDWVTNSTNPIQSKVIKSALDNKSNTGHTHQTGDITNLSIPSPSSTVPSADTTNGNVGTGVTWARSNHTHPKSSLYAEASHTHSQYLTNHQDISGKEDKSNKLTSLNGLSYATDNLYPSALVVKYYLDTKEDTSNKVTSISSSSTDDEYPSALCVYDAIDNEATRISNIEDSINDLGDMAFRDTLSEVAGSSDIIDILEQDGYSLFSGDYDDLDNKPTIPTQTSQLTNNSGFITSSSLSNYLQQSDVKDNLTSTDTNKPLSAKQGKELKTLIDNKPTVTVDSTWIANSTNPIQSKEIKTALDGKANVIDFYYDNLTDELVINTSTETDFEDLILKEDKSNKVSSWSNTPDNNHYPTEKLVKDYIDEKIGDILEYINS